MKGKTCARCGRSLRDPRKLIYSRFSHAYYCSGVKECAKRAARRPKVAA